MYLREAIAKIAGFRYMIDHLEIHSGLGRSSLLDRVWLEDAKQIKAELERVEKMVRVVWDSRNQVVLERLKVKLSQVKDIRGTVKRLKEPGGYSLFREFSGFAGSGAEPYPSFLYIRQLF